MEDLRGSVVIQHGTWVMILLVVARLLAVQLVHDQVAIIHSLFKQAYCYLLLHFLEPFAFDSLSEELSLDASYMQRLMITILLLDFALPFSRPTAKRIVAGDRLGVGALFEDRRQGRSSLRRLRWRLGSA